MKNKQYKSWTIASGITNEARQIVKRLSKANGMSIGEWLDFQIKEIDTKPPISPNDDALLKILVQIINQLDTTSSKIDVIYKDICLHYKNKTRWKFW